MASPTLLELPGDWREAGVLFADNQGFTPLIERTPAPVVIRLPDEYFNAMTDVIFGRPGTVERLIGDGIVALFGVHEEEEGDAAARAVAAALDMVAAVRRLGARAAGRPMVAAGRIRRMTRLFGAHIIAGEETFLRVRELVRYRELGTPRLKGIRRRAGLYEILALADPTPAAVRSV